MNENHNKIIFQSFTKHTGTEVEKIDTNDMKVAEQIKNPKTISIFL